MNKWLFSLLLVPVLVLTGCGASGGGASSAEAQPPAQPKTALTAAEVTAAYEQAAQAYDWFNLSTMDTKGGEVEQDGIPFHPVADPRFSTLADLETYLKTLFSDALTAQLLSEGQYRDIDGKLYASGGARGSNIYMVGKTVDAQQADEDHWTVTLTFYADSYELERPSATIGYSQTTVDYAYADGRWCFTSFCPSDDLDTDAETVYRFTYDGPFFSEADFEQWDTLKLACWMLHADGGYAEGPSDTLSYRALTHTDDYFAAMAFLAGSPWENTEYVRVASAYNAYTWFSADEQKQYQAMLDTYQPKNAAEEAELKALREAYQTAMDNPV